jgi:biotin carboxyl carrier protein
VAETSPLSVEPLGDGWYLVGDGNRRWRVAVATTTREHWVFVDGLVTQVAVESNDDSRQRAKRSSETGVSAPMPATVVAIYVTPGQSVQSGETLIVLEAMKMELPIRSPRAGVVKRVHCRKGELVQPGINLLEFE